VARTVVGVGKTKKIIPENKYNKDELTIAYFIP
jgi:hypothetical protein